ncbi:phage tail protein [Pseudomonas fluorescens]|uniref:phage tail-collar fiber domain-containing protein n=1 Tax=Pseudomonas fluorescens TaxID=294 RepID=UPI0009BA499C|nr:phage tail protein [Pseudomonas fluorescens]
MADYYTLLTDAGIAYETACKAAGTPIKLSQISVGDGGGAVYNPAATATALKREVWRGPLNALFQDEKNPSWLLAEVTIPPEVGGWYVREAGIWTDTGILYAVVKYPESFKPVLATSGSGKEFYIRSIFETSNAELVTLLIDDTVVKATRAWVMSYLADELAKLDGKQSVRVAATGNVVLNGAQQIDGVAVTAGQRVLLPSQTAARENGIWIVANDAWSRAADANTSAKVTPGLMVMVEEGAKNGDSLWHLVTNGPITLDTTALTFEMLAGRTGIAPGTYNSLTIDKYGRATAGGNPETLAGFGIKDTYTKLEIESMIAEASALPVGATVAFPLDKVAPGFLELDGSVKSIAAYPDLAAFLGTAFNKGDEGAGNFRLPESRGEFLRGWDHGRGVDPGRTIGSAQMGSYLPGDNNASDEIIYVHNASDKAGLGWDTFAGAPAAGVIRYHTVINESVPDPTPIFLHGGAARPRNLAVMWCIKAWNAPINQGNIDIAALAALATQATEVKPGTAKIATQAQTNAGADDATIVTPKKMRWGFGISLAANGYITFPTWLGGLIIQWGQINIGDISNGGSSSYSLPLAFPANHFQTLLSCAESGGGAWNAFLVSKSLLGFVWSPMEWSAVVQNAKVTYLSIGS